MLQMLKNWLNLNFFVSKLDQFLMQFDKTHPKKSASQRKEIEKYARIYRLRDNPHAAQQSSETLWEKF